jgi:hypothetical protein
MSTKEKDWTRSFLCLNVVVVEKIDTHITSMSVTCFGRGYDEMVRMMKCSYSALFAKKANVRPVYICNSLDSSLEECLQNYKDSINGERSNSV